MLADLSEITLQKWICLGASFCNAMEYFAFMILKDGHYSR